MNWTKKIIYIISYENWGDMHMSKHHYAKALGMMGNTVYFINGPDRRKSLKRGEIKIEKTICEGVYSISHRPWIPLFLKEKLKYIYYIGIRAHIKSLIRATNQKPDIVWTFDAGNSLPLSYFKSLIKIYMPVDGPFGHQQELDAAKEATLIISVTERILTRYLDCTAPKLLINHGVSPIFISEKIRTILNQPIRVGYSGSLVRNDLDIEVFLNIITSYPDMIFEFWGENNPEKSSIHLPQDISEKTKNFLEILKGSQNVILHGAVPSHDLAFGLQRMDILLIAYNIKNDQNHHKVLEYLGSGKTIVSSYMSSYDTLETKKLLLMSQNKENNDELPQLFSYALNNLADLNNEVRQNERISHAKQFTYENQIGQIIQKLKTINS